MKEFNKNTFFGKQIAFEPGNLEEAIKDMAQQRLQRERDREQHLNELAREAKEYPEIPVSLSLASMGCEKIRMKGSVVSAVIRLGFHELKSDPLNDMAKKLDFRLSKKEVHVSFVPDVDF